MITYGSTVITRQSGYPVRCRVEAFVPAVMADGSPASCAVVRSLEDVGLYRDGEVFVTPVAGLEVTA